jgi:hypothetical protein
MVKPKLALPSGTLVESWRCMFQPGHNTEIPLVSGAQVALPSHAFPDVSVRLANVSGRAAGVFGQYPVGQRLGEMQPADPVAAVEIGQRAGDPQHAMIAARR